MLLIKKSLSSPLFKTDMLSITNFRRHYLSLTTVLLILTPALSGNILSLDFLKGQKKSLKTWHSKGHRKAKGIKMKISYPAKWEAKEHTRPNILHKFVGYSASGVDLVTLTTKTLPSPYNRILTRPEKTELLAKDSAKDMLPVGATLLSHKITKIDGEMCAMAEFLYTTERVGGKFGQKGLVFIIPRPGTLLLVNCATIAGIEGGFSGLNNQYAKLKNLFLSIGSSCVFVDKWEE